MSVTATSPPMLRIGDVARLAGTTPRTIRYYEEIGLLGCGERAAGRHRTYGENEVERLREALRLKSLLGLSLDELKELMAGEDARSARTKEWHHGNPSPERRRQILHEAQAHLERQLELLARRRDEIAAFEADLHEYRARLAARVAELDGLG